MVGDEEESSDEESRAARQVCMVNSPVLMLGSCVVSLITVLLCKMKSGQK